MKYWKAGVLAVGYLFFTMSLIYSQGAPQNVDWPVYAGSPGTPSALHAQSPHAVSQYDVACFQQP